MVMTKTHQKYKTARFYAEIEAFKKDLIAQALLASNGDIRAAACSLGIHWSYLRTLMTQLKLNKRKPAPVVPS